MKGIRFLMAVAAAVLFTASFVNAQMMKGEDCPMEMVGKGGKQKMMGQGMGMMGKGGGSGMMGKMGKNHMKGGHHFYLMNAEVLDLSREQVRELENIKSGCRKKCIPEGAKLKVAKIELEELLDSDPLNMKKVEKKVKEITALKGKLMLYRIKARVEARKILTKKQREKAKKLTRGKEKECIMMKGRGMMGEMGMMEPVGTGKESDDDMSMEGMAMEKEKGSGHENHH